MVRDWSRGVCVTALLVIDFALPTRRNLWQIRSPNTTVSLFTLRGMWYTYAVMSFGVCGEPRGQIIEPHAIVVSPHNIFFILSTTKLDFMRISTTSTKARLDSWCVNMFRHFSNISISMNNKTTDSSTLTPTLTLANGVQVNVCKRNY